VATPAESAKCEREVHSFLSRDPAGSVADEEARCSPAGKRPPETEINGLPRKKHLNNETIKYYSALYTVSFQNQSRIKIGAGL
jgi:hypothetical protein